MCEKAPDVQGPFQIVGNRLSRPERERAAERSNRPIC